MTAQDGGDELSVLTHMQTIHVFRKEIPRHVKPIAAQPDCSLAAAVEKRLGCGVQEFAESTS